MKTPEMCNTVSFLKALLHEIVKHAIEWFLHLPSIFNAILFTEEAYQLVYIFLVTSLLLLITIVLQSPRGHCFPPTFVIVRRVAKKSLDCHHNLCTHTLDDRVLLSLPYVQQDDLQHIFSLLQMSNLFSLTGSLFVSISCLCIKVLLHIITWA